MDSLINNRPDINCAECGKDAGYWHTTGLCNSCAIGLGYRQPERECSRAWLGPCKGELVDRTTSGGFPDCMCESHLQQLEGQLALIAQRYPEVMHADGCDCYGCTEGSW
jgi:hypothetical protein